ncbi:MAG: hypothetical protein KGY60_06125 [Bacteroidales bacterium]|nr:hypothetical protein [Bacteroidales bacterium]
MMERIDRNNYEMYVIDYLEGRLSQDREQQMKRFLRDHPDLEQELMDLEQTRLVPAAEAFPDKEGLKKQLTLDDAGYSHFDELCISRLEGELTDEQARVFDRLVAASPERQHAYGLYQKTRVAPDRAIAFEGKEGLKKGGASRKPLLRALYPWAAMAASVLVLAGLYLFFPSPDSAVAPLPSAGHMRPAQQVSMAAADDANQVVPDPNIITHQIDYNRISPELHMEVQNTVPPKPVLAEEEATMQPLEARYGISFDAGPVYAGIRTPELPLEEFREQGGTFDSYKKLDRFLNRRVNYALASTLHRNDFSLWDVAGAGLKGISNITGKELALERHYNQKGELQRLALKTESFSFSTRVNK